MNLWILRVTGVLNIMFMVLGAYYFAVIVAMHWNKWPGTPAQSEWVIFVLLSAASLFLIAFLGYTGVKLIMGNHSALRPLGVIFILEILYFVVTFILFWLIFPASKARIAVGFWGIAQGPLVPQILTGYPLLGLISVIFLMLKKKRMPHSGE